MSWSVDGSHRVGEAERLSIDVLLHADHRAELARDVQLGFTSSPKWLPPKYFYDTRGSALFDAICDTPEYYPTRTELRLLQQVADPIVATTQATDIVELGSGSARKTRLLLEAVARHRGKCRYVPFDVSEAMLRGSARALLTSYPWLTVHGIVGDYDRHLPALPAGDRRLFVFLGGTIGNFDEGAAEEFLRSIASTMTERDYLLLGCDLEKDPAVLHAAYNDRQGLTADFNKNVLAVINRELDADFDLSAFEHVAFYSAPRSRIEMHLRSTRPQSVRVGGLGTSFDFASGELMRTEISRKFTRETALHLVRGSGLCWSGWHTSENEYFGLAVCTRA